MVGRTGTGVGGGNDAIGGGVVGTVGSGWRGAVGRGGVLAGLGAVSAQAGGAPVWTGTWRVAFWGAIAMAVTAGAGVLFGAVA